MLIAYMTTCPLCNEDNEVLIEREDLQKWDDGALVQDAFPYLSSGERELLVTGVCTPCWERSFGEE